MSHSYGSNLKPTPEAARKAAQDAYTKTAARLERIQKQVSDAPRGGKLKGKVCIVTGVGSLKGIG